MISGTGFNRCFVFPVDAQLRAVQRGTPSTTPFGGIQVVGARALTVQPAEARIITHTGDDRVLATVLLPPDDPIRGELRTAGTNLDLDAFLQGLAGVDNSTIPFAEIAPRATDLQGRERQVWLMAQRSAIVTDYNRPDAGAQRWFTRFMLAILFPRGSGWEYGGTDENTYNVVAQNASRYPWGEAIPATLGYRSFAFLELVTPAPLRLAVATGDGTATSFTLPSGHRVLGADTANIRVYVNGTSVSTFSLNAAGDTVTFTTAPASGALIHFLYQIE